MKRQTKVQFRGLRPTDPNGRNGILNPERGFRFEIGVGKIPADEVKFTHIRDHWPFARFTKDGVTIAQAYCYLTQYAQVPVIPKEKLDALQADFDRARKEGFKFLFRFAYEMDNKSDGPTLEILLGHIAQLKEIVRKNIDVIYVLQTGWVGLWGEFHTSVHGLEKDPEAVKAIVAATLDMLPESRFTMMRCMRYKEDVLKSLGDPHEITQKTAFSQAPHARIGFFNDGTLANWWDGGTFWVEPYAKEGNPEFDRVMREGWFMPVDGELFWTKQSNDPLDACGLKAVKRFQQHHYTTLSLVHGFSGLDHNPAPWTIDQWKLQMLTPAELKFNGIRFDPDYFGKKGFRSSFEFIRDHLGYRLAVTKASFDQAPRTGGRFHAEADIVNYGFSTPINKREPEFVLLGADGTVIEMKTGADCRKFQPCSTACLEGPILHHKISVHADLPQTMPAGQYTLALWFPDADQTLRYRPEYAIRLASKLKTVTAGGRLLNVLGKVNVR